MYICQLCGRTMKHATTSHHLVPRAVHRKSRYQKRFTRAQMQTTVGFCADCHRAVHDLLPDEKELADKYYTVELLREHPGIARFLQWVRKQK